MKSPDSISKSTHAHGPAVDAFQDIYAGFALLGLKEGTLPSYEGPQEFARNFVRCSRTKFTQVTYSANSNR